MKTKILFTLVYIAIAGRMAFAGTIVKVMEFQEPKIERVGAYFLINFEGTNMLGEPGKASLPFYPVKLLLPPGEIATGIHIEYEEPATLQGEFDLYPRQHTRPISDDSNGDWLVDNEFYRSDISYPSSFKPKVETHFMNGYAIALSAFTPVRYRPSTKEVSWYRRVVVTIETAPDPAGQQHRLNFNPSLEIARQVAMMVQDPETVKQYNPGRKSRTNDYDYLVITPNQYQGEFDTLISFYKPRGIRTKVATTEYISATITTGVDLQEKIRNYIIGEYQQHVIQYVLIGGDVEVVPYRGFYCKVYSDVVYTDDGIPADLYYSALDGNWNNNGDNLWGEPGEEDLYPEVGIGRMTFSDTAELHHMLHKTMLYQAAPVEGELTKPILAGEYLYGDPVTWGSDYMKLLVGYRTDNGYTSHGIPPEHPRDTLYDRYAGWSGATLMNHVNSGRPWLHHLGHASYTYAMKLNNSDITSANFSQANGINHNYTIVYTHGCMCGGFDHSDCIAERMVGIDNFAVAFIGNSRYGWFNQGTTDGPSQHLHREFMDALYYDSLYHIGIAHLKSKSETAPFVVVDTGEFEPGATRWVFYDNNLLGDPAMAAWTEEPQQVEAEYPKFIPIGANKVYVRLAGPEGIYNRFTCSIYRNDTLFGSSQTDVSGCAIVPLEAGITEGPISLIISGYNILPHYYQIEVSDYWLGMTSNWQDAANWFTGQVPDTSTNVIIPANPAGGNFPTKNSTDIRRCKSIFLELHSSFHLGTGETFSVGNN
jgi:hypothetical protein